MIQRNPTTQGRPGCASPRYLELGRLGQAELEALMRRGTRPDPEHLVGWEFRGRNVAWWAERSPILQFVKGFYRDAAGRVWGYNEPVRQDGLDAPWSALPSEADPKRFGFYRVEPVDPASRDNEYLQALLLDYGRGRNPLWEPARVLRDYLVRIDPDSDDLLLGKAYLALGPARVATNFFLLERHRPTSWARPD